MGKMAKYLCPPKENRGVLLEVSLSEPSKMYPHEKLLHWLCAVGVQVLSWVRLGESAAILKSLMAWPVGSMSLKVMGVHRNRPC